MSWSFLRRRDEVLACSRSDRSRPTEGLKVLEVFVDNMVGYSALCDAQSIDNPTLVALPVAAASAQTNTQVYRAFWQCRCHLSLDDDQSVRSMKGFSLFV